ncbi:MAG: hypothetical protein E7368_04945 [Clostridiales bacterium]|nr:hypothetical protein [Clostridiales bacterium]
MENFWDFSVWGWVILVGVLLASLLFANVLKRRVPFLKNSLVPTSVLGGLTLLLVSEIVRVCTGTPLFDMPLFGGQGMRSLEIITYHALALGFIASSLKKSDKKMTGERAKEVFNTGVTTVSTYLLQAVVGLGITLLIAMFVTDFFGVSGVLLPFGYGQGTGQALNYGTYYETEYGFNGGASFGLAVAAMGFLCASFGGVFYLNVLKRKKKISRTVCFDEKISPDEIQKSGEIPMNGSMDKLTVQIALVLLAYGLTFGVMFLLGMLLPGMKATIYGFNFLIGVLMAMLVKAVLGFLNKKRLVKRVYTNNFLLTRTSNFFFDLMVVAGIAAIRLDVIKDYWWILLILGVVGLVITYAYNLWVSRVLFKKYSDEQFLMMYGMLTGTASTGIILLRELDPDFKTPVADNLVYQNFPAIVFGFPMMLLANLAPEQPILTFIILVAFLLAMNILLFRRQIFCRKKDRALASAENVENTENKE